MPEIEDVPELEEHKQQQQPKQQGQQEEEEKAAQQAPKPQKRASKMDKKNKKAFLKSGLKEFPGVEKVSIQTASKIALAIEDPEVFRSGDTFVIFGLPRVEDAKSQQTRDVLQNILSQQGLTPEATAGEEQAAASAASTTATTGAEEEEVDAEGIQEKDIEVVMKEANVSRAKAIKAIKANKGDVVDAVVSLSTNA
jgi:nascent polypeptide-associated complex subunit alpha